MGLALYADLYNYGLDKLRSNVLNNYSLKLLVLQDCELTNFIFVRKLVTLIEMASK